MTRIVQEQNIEKQEIEKQMGCMAGFLQIFDRPHVLSGKRLYATKRLPPSVVIVDSSAEQEEKSIGSPAMSRELLEKQQNTRSMPSPERFKQSPVSELRSPATEIQSKMTLPIPIFELKEGARSSRKFCKEAPRLSLDSRATFDAAKGSLKPKKIRTNAAILSANRCDSNGEESDCSEKQRRSPSVVARLMGLEILPEDSDTEEPEKPQLRRSASESRASRDLLQYRFIDGINFQLKQQRRRPPQRQNTQSNNVMSDIPVKDQIITNSRAVIAGRKISAEAAQTANPKGVLQRKKKSFFDSADFFPEPKHLRAVSAYGEIERRLRCRGIEEPSKDLETLKQILEALQLKGLLHSEKPPHQFSRRNFVYNRSFSLDESPILAMKPARTMSSPVNQPGRIGNDSPPPTFRARPGIRRDSNLYGEASPAMSPKRYRPEMEQNVRKQTRGRSSSSPTTTPSESRVNSANRRRPLSVEPQRRASNDSAVQSPKLSPRRTGPDQTSNRTSRNRRQTVEKVFVVTEEESSTISESSFSASSQTDTERSKAEDYKDGRSLLERCDKLLHSIAEMTAAAELQPSPVSVLDSSFYKEESSPSPVLKRSIDFHDQLPDLEDESWSPAISSFQSRAEEDQEDADFAYISDIIRAFNYLPGDTDVFVLLEKQQCLKGRDTSKVSRLQRKLTFDTITEILNRRKQMPPWKAISCWGNSADRNVLTQQVWSEFRRIRERDAADDLFEVICGVLKKDLAGDATNGWGDCPIEMSEAVLDIERLIFKDLIGETIRDLADFGPKCNRVAVPRRKLVF